MKRIPVRVYLLCASLSVGLIGLCGLAACDGTREPGAEVDGGSAADLSAVAPAVAVLAPDDFAARRAALGDEAYLIDCRTPREYAGGTIEGAINIDYLDDGFAERLRALDPARPAMVFCQKGGRSAEAATALREAGFAEVYDLQGGFGAWRAAAGEDPR